MFRSSRVSWKIDFDVGFPMVIEQTEVIIARDRIEFASLSWFSSKLILRSFRNFYPHEVICDAFAK